LSAVFALITLVPLLVVTSSPTQAQSQGIWISELHYHPQSVGDGTANFDDREDTEFIEIAKFGSGSTNIGGWCFTAGIEYCFPAGTSLGQNDTYVVARDAAEFTARYGFSPDGEYDGKLSNSGDVVRLMTSSGTVAALVGYVTSDPWPVTADGGGPSLELVSNAGSNDNPANWDASTNVNGSPGSLPNVSSGAPPLVVSRSYTEVASAGQPTPITATALNTTSATLIYDINYGSNQQIPMQEIGGQWRAELPAMSGGSLGRFRIQVDGPNGSATSPRSADSVDWWAVATPTQPQSAVPVMDLFFANSNWSAVINNEAGCPCPGAVLYGGRVWTGVTARAAGYTSRFEPKKNIRLDFPDGYPLIASFLDEPADELTLDAGTTNLDQISEQVSWGLMERLGFAPIRSTHVRVENNGSFHGLFLLREEQDGSWRARHNIDRGLTYKSLPEGLADPGSSDYGWLGGVEYEKKEAFDESDADFIALSNCVKNWDVNQNALRTCMLDTVDIPHIVNEMAAMVMIGQTDQREFNFITYRDDAENGLWRMQPDDLDRVFGPEVAPNTFFNRCDAINTQANEICRALLNVPEFKVMFNRRIRTVIDRYLADPAVLAEINQTADYIRDEWADDENKWNRTNQSFQQLVNQLTTWVGDHVQYQRNGGFENNVPGAQSASANIDIIELRPDAGDGMSFAILRNPSTSEAVDVSGWTLTGIEPIRNGTIILPGQEVAVITNESAFRSTRPNFNGVRSWAEGSLTSAATLRRLDGSVADTAGSTPDARLILNEWNAVKSTNVLAGGDATLGSVPGNGGDWFELVVIDDELDVRGWKLVLSDSDGGPLAIRDTFEFANDPLLANLPAGTIITVSESFADDTAVNYVAGDWHINLQANSADDGAYFTAATQENFDTNANDWRLVILDGSDDVVFGPAGEGIGSVTGITSEEIGELEGDPSATVDPVSDYGDGDDSTFGLPNVANGATQDFGDLRWNYTRGDVNCDQTVNILDAYVVARFSVGLIPAEFRCPLSIADAMFEPAGDYSLDGGVAVNDAYLISRCAVSIPGACIE